MDNSQTPESPNDWQLVEGAPRLPILPTLTQGQVELTRALNRLENLAHCFVQIDHLKVHAETVRTLLNAYYPYKPWKLSDEVANEQAKAFKLVIAYMEGLAASNPFLIPPGYELQEDRQKLILAPMNGCYELRDDSMAPQLQSGTTVVLYEIREKEWSTVTGVVFIVRQSVFDIDFVGRVVSITDEAITISRDNPEWSTETFDRCDALRLYSVRYVVGQKVV